jgi:hypothetical protein
MIPFQLLEQTAIEAALEFANLRSIPSAEAVHGLFQGVAARSAAKFFQVIPESDIGAFVDDQAELIGWLDALSRWPKLATRERLRVHGEIQSAIGRTVGGRAQWSLADGVLQTFVEPELTGVRACYSFAAALLADESARRWKRLHRCALKGCGKWFWERAVRAGPVRQFCIDAHATAARKLRMKSKRSRKS